MEVDAIVIGAGPAGSTAALFLARAGWSVALVEKAVFPRRKVCGEFLSAATLPVLRECGVAQAYGEMAGPPVLRLAVYADEGRPETKPASRPWGRALGREHLDVLLRDAAVMAGARLYQPAELAAMRRLPGGHACTLQTGAEDIEIRARIVIAANGSWTAKGPLALPMAAAMPTDLLAFKAHFRGGTLGEDLMPLLAFPGGYGGMVHSDDGRTSLSCCLRRDVLDEARARHGGKAGDAVLAHIQATTRGAREALTGAALDGAILAAGPIRPGLRPPYADGVFYTGNGAGEAHPIIAEGISMAIQSSRLLSAILGRPPLSPQQIEGAGQAYARAWRRRFSLRIHAAALFSQLAMRDGLRAAALPLLRQFPAIMALGAKASGKV